MNKLVLKGIPYPYCQRIFLLVGFVLTFCKFSYAGAESTAIPNLDSKIESYIEKSKNARTGYDFIKADIYLDTALMYALNGGNQQQLAEVYHQKGNIKKLLNDVGSALDFFLHALQIFQRIEAWKNLTILYTDLAEFYRKTRKFEDAKEYINKAKNTFFEHQIQDTVVLIKIYNRSAAIKHESNPNPYVSMEDSKIALNLASLIGDSSLMAVSFNELGFSYKNLKQTDSSEYFYLQAEKFWMSTGKYQEALHAMSNRAQLYAHAGYDRNEVINLYERIIFLSDSLKANYRLMDVAFILHGLYLEKKDTAKAFKYFKMHHDETLIVYDAQTNNELHNVYTKFQNEKIQTQFNKVSQQLNETGKTLEEKNQEQLFLISFLVILFILLSVIVSLFIRIRKSNKILAAKNNEKDSLIQEIHHRVKNNLQFISSLINMQLKTTTGITETESLHETSRRINAMALVHEMLYNRAEQKGISAKYYLEELIESLYALINSDSLRIEFKMEIIDVDLNVSDTISIGMITSELISNSMKHAFNNTSSPEVKIILKKNNETSFTYTISDNGAGIDQNKKKENTLGLRLVDIFSRQLKGNYSIDGSNGFTYTINFNTK